jgi:hypothetical protein
MGIWDLGFGTCDLPIEGRTHRHTSLHPPHYSLLNQGTACHAPTRSSLHAVRFSLLTSYFLLLTLNGPVAFSFDYL